MKKITVSDLLNNCRAKLLIGNETTIINECFVDSRKVMDGGCFFGINGDKVNGSLYYKEAFDNGASVCVLSKLHDLDLKGYDDKTVLIAENPLEVLQDLATYKRSLFKGPVVGITGSVGKTSTKEMLVNVLKQNYKVLSTKGNENSQTGLPLNILRLNDEDVMVLEMGMSRKGEMHNLSMIAKPDIALITNVFDSHIGNLGSRENILKAKLEIIDGMDSGTLIINNDNDMLKKVSSNIKKGVKVMAFGVESKSNIMPKNVICGINAKFDVDDLTDLLVSGGKTFIYNALACYLISKLLGVSRSMIKRGINGTGNKNHRLEIINIKNNVTLIDDSYNASYDSVKTALDYLDNFSGKKIAILGDVLELGKEAKKIHKRIGNLIVDNRIDELVTVGKYSKHINRRARRNGMKRSHVKHFKTELKARCYVEGLLTDDSVVLIKGSNGINLINMVEYLKKKD